MEEYVHIDISKLLHCGVYCLLRKGVVVYVGKTKRPLIRLKDHENNRNSEMPQGRRSGGPKGPTHKGRGINFDGIWFVPCMLGQLDVIEKVLIKKYLPKYNIRGMPPQPIPLEIKELLREMGWVIDQPLQQDPVSRTYMVRRL